MSNTTSGSVALPVDVRELSLHDEIAGHARVLWEKYGEPAGRDQEIWLEAERQVLGTDLKIRKVGDGTVSAALFARGAIE